MNRERAIQFCQQYADKQFYQPIVFVPDIIEIQGKWNTATKDLADLILSNCSGKSVLDLGCMHGYFLHEAIKRGASQAVGVDHDTVEMSLAREIKDILELPIELVEAKIEDFEPPVFDIVLMMNITHVLNEPENTIQRFLKLAKELLVIEYRPGHESAFPRQPDKVFDSPRSAGYRKLALFEAQSE